MQENLLSR